LPFRSICCLAVGLGGTTSGSGGGGTTSGSGGGAIASGGGGGLGDIVVGNSVVGADERCPDRSASAMASAARKATAVTTSKVVAFLRTLRKIRGRAALRWHGRLCREVDVSLEEAQAILATLVLMAGERKGERGLRSG
jgi:hypothetical protein